MWPLRGNVWNSYCFPEVPPGSPQQNLKEKLVAFLGSLQGALSETVKNSYCFLIENVTSGCFGVLLGCPQGSHSGYHEDRKTNRTRYRQLDFSHVLHTFSHEKRSNVNHGLTTFSHGILATAKNFSHAFFLDTFNHFSTGAQAGAAAAGEDG